MSLETLPPEIHLLILSYLPISALRSLQLSCKSLKNVIDANEETIYQSAYHLHGFSSSPTATLEATSRSISSSSIRGFKSLCECRFRIEASWAGQGPSSLKRHATTGPRVFRFKVDDDDGFIINSDCDGGIVVTDIRQSNRILWSLDSRYVRSHAHVEYDNGFLAFSNRYSAFEIWRRATDFPPGTHSPGETDSRQDFASQLASEQHANADGSLRGHFRPWALFDFSNDIGARASRLVYPTFVAASAKTAYLFDLPSARPCGQIDNLSEGSNRPWISYVDLSKRYLFVCLSANLHVYRRPDVPDEPGEKFKAKELVFKLSGTDAFGPWTLRLDRSPIEADEKAVVLPTPHKMLKSEHHVHLRPPIFSAVHALADASTIIVAMDAGGCVIIPDFLSLINGDTHIYDSVINVSMPPGTGLFRYISYDTANDRFTLALSSRVYIFKLVWREMSDKTMGLLTNPRTGLTLDENVLVSQVVLPSQAILEHLHCIQMTDTRLWLTHQDTQLEQHGFLLPEFIGQMIFSVDFQGNRLHDHPLRTCQDT